MICVPLLPLRIPEANAPESQGWYVQSGSIGGEKVRIWTRKYATKIANPAVPVVMVHGMAAGLAYYVTNFGPLSKDRDVYALDWPGFARSSRPKFTTTDDSAEHEFIEALECWRHSVGLERFILLGHSFGGYLSASYALRHPDRVAHLMLVDPWGFPERPENFTPRRTFPWWLRGLFHVFKNFNPLASLRLSGPFGVRAIKRMRPDLVAKYSSAFDVSTSYEMSTLLHSSRLINNAYFVRNPLTASYWFQNTCSIATLIRQREKRHFIHS